MSNKYIWATIKFGLGNFFLDRQHSGEKSLARVLKSATPSTGYILGADRFHEDESMVRKVVRSVIPVDMKPVEKRAIQWINRTMNYSYPIPEHKLARVGRRGLHRKPEDLVCGLNRLTQVFFFSFSKTLFLFFSYVFWQEGRGAGGNVWAGNFWNKYTWQKKLTPQITFVQQRFFGDGWKPHRHKPKSQQQYYPYNSTLSL